MSNRGRDDDLFELLSTGKGHKQKLKQESLKKKEASLANKRKADSSRRQRRERFLGL